MPQMMPIAWMQMFMLTNITLMIIVAKTYFSKTYSYNKSTMKNLKNPSMKWTW